MPRILVCLFLWSCLNLSLSAQEFRFEALPEEIGLSLGTVNDIYQDQQGFIWLATWSGLYRYDGYEVKSYQVNNQNPLGLKTNKITSIFQDSQGFIWVGTRRKGVYRYDPTLERFDSFDQEKEPNLENENVWCIKEDAQHQIWIGTEGGLDLYDPSQNSFRHFTIGQTQQENFIYDLLPLDNKLYIGTEGGLFVMATQTFALQKISLIPEIPGAFPDRNNYIYKLVEDPLDEEQIWVGTKGGLKLLKVKHKDEWEIQHFQHDAHNPNSLSHNFVQDILVAEMNGKKVLWIASFQGLNLLDVASKSFQSFFVDNSAYALNNHTIRSLFLDRTGILWIGSERGVNKLNLTANPFYSLRIPDESNSNQLVVSGIKGQKGKSCMYVATRGGGLYCLKMQKEGSYLPQKISLDGHDETSLINFISNLEFDAQGNLWLLTQGTGAVKIKASALSQPVIKKTDYQVFSYSNGNLGDDYVMSAWRTKSGNLWLGHWNGGLDFYDATTQEFKTFQVSSDQKVNFLENPVVTLYETYEDEVHFLWVGTRGGGVFQMRWEESDRKLHLHAHHEESSTTQGLSNNFVNAFAQDQKGNLWIGTENGINLFHSQTGSFEAFYEADGLPNNIVQGILVDDQDKLWVSTQSGLGACALDEKTGKIRCQAYYQEDGLQGNYFNGNVAFKQSEETLLFGGIQGLTFFNPHQIQKEAAPPEVAIVSFSVFNEEMEVGKEMEGRILLPQSLHSIPQIKLSHRDKVISFSFTGMHYAQPAKNLYAYKLEGFDKEWVYTDADRREVHYTNLPYREYVFKVKAANPDGVWSEEAVSLALKVSPPWWLTIWAKIGYVLFGIGLLYAIRRITLVRIEYRNELALAKMKQEKLEEVDRIKTQFFTNISHELRTPLTLIISPLEDLIKSKMGDRELKNTIGRMHRNGHRLLHMINQLLDLRKSDAGLMQLQVAEGNIVKFISEIILSFRTLAQEKEIALRFLPQEDPMLIWYDRDQLEKVFFNLLSNAVKFTPTGGSIQVSMGLSSDQKEVEILVEDSGVGIPPEDQPYIFQQFYQSTRKSTDGKYEGSGVGLALSKNIIQAHQGRIELESQTGRGSTFKVILPLGDGHFTSDQKLADFKDSENALHYLQPQEIEPSEKTESILSKIDHEGERKQILVVEDNDDIRTYIKESLEAHFDVWEAANGKEGLSMAQEKDLALIISDIAMPEMDGIEFCTHIKSDIQTSHIPVILLTARTSLIYKIDGFEKGADDYVTKPFNMQLLKTRIDNLIQSRQRLREVFKQGYELSPSNLTVASLDEEFLQKVLQLIEDHMDDPAFSVEQMGREIGMSRMQLYRKLKALTGFSPNQVIRNIRLKRAAQLLETNQYTVAEVTYQVGFQDLKYFRERFKKEFGVSPSAYAESSVEG